MPLVQDVIKEMGYMSLGSRLKRLGEQLQADVQRLSASNGLNVQSGHYPLLAALSSHGALTVGELVMALNISQPGVTRSIGQLEQQGYVDITRSDTDQRSKSITLTRSGKKLVKQSREKIWLHIESSLETLCRNRSGELLELLDFLETKLSETSLEQRVNIEIDRK